MGNKNHLVKWEALAKQKDFGGLGFIHQTYEPSPVAKWIFKLKSGEESMCLNLLKRKYLNGKSLCQTSGKGGSQFWQGLHAVNGWYEKGKTYVVESGRQARFWEDVWTECPLKTAFSKPMQDMYVMS